ncbi:hypothetical protein GCM10027295_21070 [Pseudaeromonas pectinilytica]
MIAITGAELSVQIKSKIPSVVDVASPSSSVVDDINTMSRVDGSPSIVTVPWIKYRLEVFAQSGTSEFTRFHGGNGYNDASLSAWMPFSG